MDVNYLREKIDHCDRQLIVLLKERLIYTQQMSEAKRLANYPSYDPIREARNFQTIAGQFQNDDERREIMYMFRLLMDLSRKQQQGEMPLFFGVIDYQNQLPYLMRHWIGQPVTNNFDSLQALAQKLQDSPTDFGVLALDAPMEAALMDQLEALGLHFWIRYASHCPINQKPIFLWLLSVQAKPKHVCDQGMMMKMNDNLSFEEKSALFYAFKRDMASEWLEEKIENPSTYYAFSSPKDQVDSLDVIDAWQRMHAEQLFVSQIYIACKD